MSLLHWRDYFHDRWDKTDPSYQNKSPQEHIQLGHFSLDEYFEWVVKHQQGCLLQSRFFSEQKIDTGLMKNNISDWSEYYFPIAVWDNSLIVAGVENLKPNAGYIFVYADPESLSQTWQNLNQSQSSISLNDFDEITQAMAPQSDEVPEGLSFDQLVSPQKPPTIQEQKSSLSFKNLMPVSTIVTEEKNNQIQQRPKTKNEPRKIEENHLCTLAELNSKISNLKGTCYKIIESLEKQYDQVMIMSLQPNQKSFMPYLWTSNFALQKKNILLDISEPSFLRIPLVTEKPYHGYIIPNESNRILLESLNLFTVPENATIVPLHINKKMIGLLTVFADRSHASLDTLHKIENLCREQMMSLSASSRSSAA